MFNPLYWHLEAAQRDDRVRYIYLCGGAGAAKTYTIAQCLSITSMAEPYSALVLRKESSTVMKSVYQSFKDVQARINKHLNYFSFQDFKIRTAGGDFVFSGIDDPEKIKGIERFNSVYFNELTKCDEEDLDEAKRRLRGRPNQKIYADWNRISEDHWTERSIINGYNWTDAPKELDSKPYSRLDDLSQKKIAVQIDPETGDEVHALLFIVTYRDNYWITGSPCGTYGFRDTATLANFEEMRVKKPRQYAVYGLGQAGTIRTGGEFWKSFDVDKHVGEVPYMNGKDVHISIDINRLPYISQSLWQVNDGQLRQFDELCATTPDNTAVRAAQKVADYLHRINFEGVAHIYGDASGKAKTAIDNDSFFGIYLRALRQSFVVNDRIMKSNPSVSLSGAFVNEIYEGCTPFSIIIGDNCTLSKNDYNSVKEGKDGEMVKEKIKDSTTGVAYEKGGHLSDAKRYFVVRVLEKEFLDYKRRRKIYTIL
jgi:hypothetical protein